jgi:uncharacterized protein YjiS (DUF1127 family)
MGPISGLFTADFTAAATADVTKPSVGRTVYTAVASMITTARKSAAERHLRVELANMDDALLKDIGVAEDEIYLIRAGQVFTPRAWAHKPRTRN